MGRVLGLPVLVGLFAVAVALGTLGRVWLGPATMLSHLDAGGTAAVAAGASVLVNNLPAASLLASRVPPWPYALLVGLDIGSEPLRHRVAGVGSSGSVLRGPPGRALRWHGPHSSDWCPCR